ncbi:MAG: FAD-binding oxidoreductase [Myxococcales bacterium]|nr:FAD-binding oxidoreductase [Myxococcales bacterium]MDH5306065.1 FAD-binding oxidoreductase [Myxococcales bacterium]MDH5567007.1 FAD-binding oxidoreductase [Myxococcales bacterium]
MQPRRYRSVSYWFDALGAEPQVRGPLPGDLEVDVAIVGGGFTGLWTAYYLKRADPDCRVAVLERETAGYGASGRNGGWCWAKLAGLPEYVARDPERGAALRDAVMGSVDEIGGICEREGIEADFRKAGGFMLASVPAQVARLRAMLKTVRQMGLDAAQYRWVEPAEMTEHFRVAANFGAVFMANCAGVNPAALARGIADAAERRGAAIYEQTPVLDVAPGLVRTAHGNVRAARIVLALAGYLAQLPGHRRDVLPCYNHMIATEPLPRETWERIGLARREGFGDVSRMLAYGQRTHDDRIAIGGRGLGYHFGSSIDARFDRDARTHRLLEKTLHELLPQLGDVAITHRWGGVFGMPRDLTAALRMDEATGIAVAPSYVGDGVAASNLAGRTLCDLVLERRSPLVEFPWVTHRAPRWEPEPLRWLGVRAGLALNASAERSERRSGRLPPLRDRVLRSIGLDFSY